MLHVPVGASTFGNFTPSTVARPSATQGTIVTPSTVSLANAGWAQLYTATSTDTYGLLIAINSNSINNATRRTVVDIGIDPAGATTYTVIIPNLIAGGAPSYLTEGMAQWYYFPIYIPRGSTIAARAYGTVATQFRVMAWAMQNPSNAASIRRGSFVEAIGVGSPVYDGTILTPGTTAKSNWQLLGTTTQRLWWWQLGLEGTAADTSYAANSTIHLDLGVGDGSAAGTDMILQDFPIRVGSAAETYSSMSITVGCEWSVPAGSSIYVRGQNAQANETGGYNIIAYGLGG